MQQHQVEQHLEEVEPTEGNYPDDRKMGVYNFPLLILSQLLKDLV